MNELSKPLLDNSTQHESDEEEGCMPLTSLTLAIVYGEDDNEESCQEAAEDDSHWCNNFLALVILPALLCLQFGMAFSMGHVQAETGLRWSVVNYSIVMFVVIAALYRQTVQECKMTSTVALLLPEIIMDIVLGIVLCDQIIPAFLLLLCSMLCLSIFVMASSIHVDKASPKGDCDEVSQPVQTA
jgi:hypothetical protein